MYVIRTTQGYRKSIKKLTQSGVFPLSELEKIIDLLANDKNLPAKYGDHALSGTLKNFRECHIKNDVLLMYYKKETGLVLVLVNVGSHSHLFK